MDASERATQLKQILNTADRRRSDAGNAEGVASDEEGAANAPLESAERVLERVECSLPSSPNCGEYEAPEYLAVRDMLLTHGKRALEKLEAGDAGLSVDQLGALEAIVIADGSRPSFLLRDGEPDPTDPFIGGWVGEVSAHARDAAKIAKVVGRIQPGGGHASNFLGTGTLVDVERGLILTNYHVMDDARVKHGIGMEVDGSTCKVTGTLEIDFLGEAHSAAANRYRITGFELPENAGRGFGHVDAVIGFIEPTIDSLPASDPLALPRKVPVLSRDASYASGGMTSLVTVGFPGPPGRSWGVSQGEHGDIDWEYVTKVLFKNKFGFKRLAPGRFTSRLQSSTADSLGAVLGHDATTFGGASGSLLLAWADEDAPAFALHFAGSLGRRNHALSFYKVADALTKVGASFG